MGLLSIFKTNTSKYRYSIVSYTLMEYMYGLDDIMHLVDGTVNINSIDKLIFMKCGLLGNIDEAVKKLLSNDVQIESLIISDAELVNIISVDDYVDEFKAAVNAFADSFKIDDSITSNNTDNTYYNKDFYKVTHDWDGLKLIYTSKNIGTEQDFLKSTLGEIMSSIQKYCIIENGNYKFNRYEKSDKSNNCDDALIQLAMMRKMKEEGVK